MNESLDRRVAEARRLLHNAAAQLRDAHAVFLALNAAMDEALERYREANAALAREDGAMFNACDNARELAKAGDSVARLSAQEKV